MGEAKRRRESDPFFGRRAKAGKGIVVSPRIRIGRDGSFESEGAGVDPVELRRAVLFWDRINKPRNNLVSFGLSADEQFLVDCGILEEIEVRVRPEPGLIGFLYAQRHLAAFSELERREPGLWSMSEGESSFNLQAGSGFSEGRGALVELYRAIPLPTEDAPLEDLLNFKEKRRDEVLSLSIELDSLFSRISTAEDAQFELGRAIREIDQRCSDIISAGKEAKIRFSLSDFTYGISLEFNSTNLMASGALGAILGERFELPLAGAAIGLASSFLKLSAGLGGRLERSKKAAELAFSPYRVVSRLISEPI